MPSNLRKWECSGNNTCMLKLGNLIIMPFCTLRSWFNRKKYYLLCIHLYSTKKVVTNNGRLSFLLFPSFPFLPHQLRTWNASSELLAGECWEEKIGVSQCSMRVRVTARKKKEGNGERNWNNEELQTELCPSILIYMLKF